jgi:hypothetical protein
MDELDHVLAPARDLLGRVDAALVSTGAPADHPIWPLLRRVGSLPGDALEFAAGVDGNALRAACDELKAHAERYADLGTRIEIEEWTGPAAATFAAHSHRLHDHLGGEDGLAGRLLATAEHFERLATWGADLRGELAYAIAESLTSTEAVTLHQDRPATETSLAAAAIGVAVLAPLAARLPPVEALLDGASLGELPYRPPATGTVGSPTETSVPT